MITVPSAFAAPVYNPENGHYYEYVVFTDGWILSYYEAEDLKFKDNQGYLATITSASENAFVAGLVPDDATAWIGLTDVTTEGEYKWINGEPFVYSNWNPNQPDNHNNDEDYIEFYGDSGKWNDNSNHNGYTDGFVVEYTLPTYNPENGHYYEYIGLADWDTVSTSWLWDHLISQRQSFDGNRGHLATITSASENAFVTALLPHDSRAWIGLTDVTTEGEYKWINGEPFVYSNWNPNQPDNSNDEDYIELLQYSGKWNDNADNYDKITGYVVEYTPRVSDPVYNPENGHYYELVYSSNTIWYSAAVIAESSTFNGLNGHLVTITSQSENDFVASLSDDDFRPWIGLTDRNTEGEYKWVTGEPFTYSNWSPGEPSAGTDEDYIEFFASNDKWNDIYTVNDYTDSYVVEYSP